ncbi:MAG: GntR family transcriptional regulator [Bacillus sp. (in: firmicutes)]|nr:GntR family transcriptional regulator [Bacillus sp. 1NLA3E]MDF2903682.1 GntR family transcriptional regulator [Bacillus sp. (in: firmicutes)]
MLVSEKVSDINLNTSQNSKVYLEIVKQLRMMIESDNLKSGDKLPSERELTERLNVGRSSVREALRSLELLGLIETRRGEGTFIRDFRGHQLVELLSTFVLQDKQAKKDVPETKYLIELDSLLLIVQRNNDEKLNIFYNWVQNNPFSDDEYFLNIVKLSENRLLLRIWLILKEYYNSLPSHEKPIPTTYYSALVEALIAKDQLAIISVYSELRKLSGY